MQLIIDGGREAFNGSDFSEGHGLQRYDEISSDIIDMRTGPCANAARVLGNSITFDLRKVWGVLNPCPFLGEQRKTSARAECFSV